MPSKRHIELQNMVATWINNRAFKCCGLPEVRAVGYVADFFALAGMWDQYHTKYAIHSGMEKMYVRPQLDGSRVTCGDIDRWYACVFEVKVSRADFLNTFGSKNTAHAKARMEPVGTAHWVVAEKGICQAEELPDFWGLLVPYGAGLTEKKKPLLNKLTQGQLNSYGFDMLWLQMNCRQSYYDQIREMAQTIRLVNEAVIRNKPIGEIQRRCKDAIESCNGMLI